MQVTASCCSAWANGHIQHRGNTGLRTIANSNKVMVGMDPTTFAVKSASHPVCLPVPPAFHLLTVNALPFIDSWLFY